MVFICNFLAFALLVNSYFIIQWHRMCCVDMVFINDTLQGAVRIFKMPLPTHSRQHAKTLQ